MLKPPNGCAPTIAPVHLRLMYRLPTKNSRLARSIFSRFRVYTAPVRPYSVLFAIASDSSKLAAGITASTGPKISSCAIGAPGFTSAITVGWMK